MEQYGQDYMPKYRVGRHVIVYQALATERLTKITGRRVYRDKNHPNGDTYYEFADGDGAWEWAVSPVSDRLAPETAMTRIVDAFAERLSYSSLTVVRQQDDSHNVHVHLEARHVPEDGKVERIDLWANAATNREVETIGPWSYMIGNVTLEAENLGAAIVQAYNHSMYEEV